MTRGKLLSLGSAGMPRAKRVNTAIALTSIMVGVLVGCSSLRNGTPSADGPINNPEQVEQFSETESCAAVGMRKSAFGAGTLTNTGEYPVTINRITLGDPKNVTLFESVIVPGEEAPGRTLITNWPIKKSDYLTEYLWEKRKTAEGAVIEPGQTYELILRVGTTQKGKGSFSSVTTFYSYEGEEFQFTAPKGAKLGQELSSTDGCQF